MRNLPAFEVTLSNKTSYVTSMAKGITIREAKQYFLGQWFDIGDTEEHPKSLMVQAISVREVK